MRSIHRLFIDADQEPIRSGTIEMGRKNLCWYPSAGTDFRHITLLEEDGLKNPDTNPPLIYLHTDIRLPENWDESTKPMTSPFFVVGNMIAPNLQISNVTEIHLKNESRDVSREVCSWNADENTGSVYFVEAELDIIFCKRLIKIPVPIIYFMAENTSFLVNILLHYQLRVNTLIHIKDGGGSLGGSLIPMNFIYQAADLLKLKRVISDESPELKVLNTRTDFDVLMYMLRRSESYYSRKMPNKFHSSISEQDIRSAWESKLIEGRLMRPNEFSPRNQCYYDWRSRKTTNAQ